MNIIMRSVSDIIPYSKNAKKHDRKQIANVAESIRQFGFVQPIVIDRMGVIVIGHCRYAAAMQLGMEAVPCVCVDGLTDEQVDKLRLLDNRLNESPWDAELLAEHIPLLTFEGFDVEWALPDTDIPEFGEDDDDEDGSSSALPKTIRCPKCGFEWVKS